MTTSLRLIAVAAVMWSCMDNPSDQVVSDPSGIAEVVDLDRPPPAPRGQCGDRCSGAADCGAILCTTCAAPAGSFKGTCMTSLPLGFVEIGASTTSLHLP